MVKEKEIKEPEIEPEAETATERKSHKGKNLADLTPGDNFVLEGKRYRFTGLEDKTAHVILLKTTEIGVEALDMPPDTIIEP